MLKCPRCDKGFSEVRFSGWTVMTEGTATIDGTGRISVVGPMVARCSVKQGHEIEGKHVLVYCPECGHSDHISKFPRVLRCFVSGGVGDIVLNNPVVGNLAVARQHQALAEALLNPRSLDWECTDISATVFMEFIRPVLNK